MRRRRDREPSRDSISIYEVHLGSWQRMEDGGFLDYRTLAERLASHVERLGFSHVEL
jgi:1,4-alpha-glucan branching enzyme